MFGLGIVICEHVFGNFVEKARESLTSSKLLDQSATWYVSMSARVNLVTCR